MLENDFDVAVRDFCRPSPTVHLRTIPVPGTAAKAIVAVNVEPILTSRLLRGMRLNGTCGASLIESVGIPSSYSPNSYLFT
jgi:hypothetical protein